VVVDMEADRDQEVGGHERLGEMTGTARSGFAPPTGSAD
jgi:hypothetical protein